MYERQIGDNLLSKDKRLKYNWRWSRIASQIPEEELRKWTHFQCSGCKIREWELEATQWGSGDDVTYEATIDYNGAYITGKEGFETRIDAQIGAENILKKWIQEQYNLVI